jgi:hypothetical protein
MTFSDLFEFLLYLLQKKSYNILFRTTFFYKNVTFFVAHSMCIICSLFEIASLKNKLFNIMYSRVSSEFCRHGIPLTRNSIDKEFLRHEFPLKRNSVDTEFHLHGILHIFFTSIYSVCYAMLFIFISTQTEFCIPEFRIQNYMEFRGILRILRASLYNI